MNKINFAHKNWRGKQFLALLYFEKRKFYVLFILFQVRHGVDSFLLLTTDGLSFVLSDQELMDIVTSCHNPSEAAKFITDQALQFGSEDNSTAVVIPFGAWGKYQNTTRSIPYSFGRNLFSNRYSWAIDTSELVLWETFGSSWVLKGFVSYRYNWAMQLEYMHPDFIEFWESFDFDV